MNLKGRLLLPDMAGLGLGLELELGPGYGQVLGSVSEQPLELYLFLNGV